MSFKEDFVEALRSVKRDFFRESEYSDTDSRAPADTAETEYQKADGAEDAPPATRDDPAEDERQAESDEVVYEAFKQASAIDEGAVEPPVDDDDEGDDGMNSSDFTPPPPFRSFDPPHDDNQEPEAPGQPDGKISYNYTADDVYSDEKTVISKNTVIRGALQTDDSVRMLGQILGDIECRSNIVVAGKVRGNTSAANAYVVNAQIDGDVYCDDVISINKEAWVLGDVHAQQAEIDGKLKGNIEVRQTVSVGADSAIIGNISTNELEIKRGAFVNGQIMMYSPSREVLDRFDHFE